MRAAVLLAIVVWGGVAGAAPVAARLDFASEAAGCPDEPALRAAVESRLGVDPFSSDAARTLVVRFGRDAGSLVARIEIARDGRRARRTLRAGGGDCAELAGAVALAVSLAIDPQYDPSPRPEPVAPARPSLADPIIVTDEELPAERPPRRGPWQVGVGSFASFGGAPELTLGVRVELGLETRSGSFAFEPWLTLPAATTAPGGHVSMSTIAASFVACRPLFFLSACGELSGGVLQAVGEGAGFATRSRTFSPFGAGGGRLAWSADVSPGLGLRVYFDLLVPFLRTRLTSTTSDGEIEAWTSPTVIPSLGIAFLGRFP